MNTNRDSSSYTKRLMAQAILQGKRQRYEDVNAGLINIPMANVYDYSVLIPANKEVAFQPITPWLYTSQSVTNEPEVLQQEIYGYPPNAPQTEISDRLLTYSVDEKSYAISVSSSTDTSYHSFLHLFNDNLTDVWATSANEYQNIRHPNLDYSGAWIRVELPFAIYPTGVRLSSRQGIYFDQRPKNFRVYGQTSGGQTWNALYDSSGVSWSYSGTVTPDQTKEFSFSTNNVAYKNFLIVMQNNYYEESSVVDKQIHILQYISLAEYKILGYPDAFVDSNLPAPSLVYALADDSAAYIYFNPPSTGTPVNYMYSINNGTSYTIISPASIFSPIKITNLTNESTYQIKLKAVSAIGKGMESTSLSVTPSLSSLPFPWLYFDPANLSSYSGTGTSVANIGSYDTTILTGTKDEDVTHINGTGISRKVFDFNGEFGSVISFPQFNFGTTISVCAWIYPRAKTPLDTINGLLTNAAANVPTNGFKFQWNFWNINQNVPGSRNIGFQAGNSTVGNDDYSPAGTIQYNEWQHVAYVFDQANRKILFFWNGVPTRMGSDAIPVANIGMNQVFNIGGYVEGSYTMNAQLGYIKVFNSLLTASDVYAEFNSSKSEFNL
jgi:hypothetical protein